MFADGVLVHDPVTGVVTVNVTAMPLVPGDLILAGGCRFDDQFNCVALAEMLNATGAHYTKEDVDGLISCYRSNPTGDVITLASIERLLAAGALTRGESGQVEVDPTLLSESDGRSFVADAIDFL